MVVKAAPPVPMVKFTRREESILKELNLRLKKPEVKDKGDEILGAIKNIDASSECMVTIWARLDATGEKLKTSHRSIASRLFGKKPILTASIVTELQAQIRNEFPMADFIPKEPTEGDDIDLLLESLVVGASKHRFFQLGSAEEFVTNSDEIQGRILRSFVTGLRGVANFHNASFAGGASIEASSDYGIEEVLKIVNMTRSMKGQPAYVYDSPEIKELSKFRLLGQRAFDLLMKKDLCYGGHETSLKDWGALSASETHPVNLILKALKVDLAKIKEQGADTGLEQAILGFITALNAKISAAVWLAMDFETRRHQSPEDVLKEEAAQEEAKKQEEDSKADTASAPVQDPIKLLADIAKEATRVKPLRKTIVRRPTLKQADAPVAKVLVRYSGIKVDDESDDEEGSPQARRLSFTESPEPLDPIPLPVPSEMQVAAVSSSTYTLPVGFECYEGEYVYRGNALSPENKAARDALAMDMTKPAKTALGGDFDAYSDGMYRLCTDPYYMLVGERVFSSDLKWELAVEPLVPPAVLPEPDASTSLATSTEIKYKVIPVADGQIIILSPGIVLTTPVRII